MKKICFLISDDKYEFEGVVRPFINWVTTDLKKNDLESYLILYNCGERLIEHVNKLKNVQCIVTKNFNDVLDKINLIKPSIIFSDDNIKRLYLINKIKKNFDIKTGVYVQILFGVHSIVDVFNLDYLTFKEKIIFKTIKFVPFLLLKSLYKRLINSQDIIIANSQITSFILHTLYGIEPNGIVYPPINTEIFKSCKTETKDQVLLYLGSHAGDTDENLVKEICKILKNKDIKILVMGNKILQEKLSKEFEIQAVSGVSDKELAKIYSECKLTICPQEWEQFGYVVAESVTCETPVLAFNMMGSKEIVEQTNFGLLANNKREFLELLSNFEKLTKELKYSSNFPFDSRESYKNLIRRIENA